MQQDDDPDDDRHEEGDRDAPPERAAHGGFGVRRTHALGSHRVDDGGGEDDDQQPDQGAGDGEGDRCRPASQGCRAAGRVGQGARKGCEQQEEESEAGYRPASAELCER